MRSLEPSRRRRYLLNGRGLSMTPRQLGLFGVTEKVSLASDTCISEHAQCCHTATIANTHLCRKISFRTENP
jgi:hypothetical protein